MDKQQIANIKKDLNKAKDLDECACELRVMSDPTRAKICWLLCKYPELSVGDIAEVLDVSVSTVSHSLRKMKSYDLVTSRKDSRSVLYKLKDRKTVEGVRSILDRV